MADVFCLEAMKVLNRVFDERVVDRHLDDLIARFSEGDSLKAVLIDLAEDQKKFKKNTRVMGVGWVAENWPESHLQVVRSTVLWALSQRQQGNPIKLNWKGDAENDETVTRIEITGDEVTIEFAHPPAAILRQTG